MNPPRCPLTYALRSVYQAASLYERAVNIEETAERHVWLADALVSAERKNEALRHYGRAADLHEDRQDKAREVMYIFFGARIFSYKL